MKKNIFLIAGIALTAMLSGCADENLDNTVKNPVKSGEEIMFGSELSGDADVIEAKPGTRTVYGDRNKNGVPVYWEADGSDKIAIFCNQASQPADHLVTYKITPDETDHATAATVAKVNPSEAGLQWGDLDTEHRFYAFYPASAVKGSAEEVLPIFLLHSRYRNGEKVHSKVLTQNLMVEPFISDFRIWIMPICMLIMP